MLNKKALIALLSLLILVLQLPAFADSFTMTTNNDIYALDEKAIIIGAVPVDTPHGYAVLVKVTGPGRDYATQNMLPAADNSFR